MSQEVATIKSINARPELVMFHVETILTRYKAKSISALTAALEIREYFGLQTFCKEHNKPITIGSFCDDCIVYLKGLLKDVDLARDY